MKSIVLFGLLMALTSVAQCQKREQLRAQLKTASHDTVRLRLSIEISNTFFRENQYDSLRKVVQQALPMAYRNPKRVYLGKLIYRMGLFYLNKRLFEKAIREMKIAERLFEQIADTTNLSHVKYAIATTHLQKGDYKEGLAKALANLTYFLTIKNVTYESYTYTQLTEHYRQQNDRPRQRYYMEKFVQLAQKSNDPHELVVAYGLQAAFYEEQGEYRQAWLYRKKALNMARIVNRPLTSVGQLRSMAAYLHKQNRPGEALPYLQEALTISNRTNDRGLQGVTLQELAINHLQRGNHKQALHLAQKAVSVLQLVYGPNEYAAALKNLATVQEATGHYQQALKTFKAYNIISDSLLSAERTAKIAQIQSQYDLERKEATILLLNKNAQLQTLKTRQQQKELATVSQHRLVLITGLGVLALALGVIVYFLRQRTAQKRQIELQARQLQENNALKDQLFAIIGHDLRSPVASIKNSLTLVKLKGQQTTDMDEVEQQINSLYNTLDNLLYWSLNQRDGIRVMPRLVNLADIVCDVLESFDGLLRFKKLAVRTELHDIMMRIDENLTMLVLRNILHNAFKFSQEGGTVHVRIQSESAQVKLLIADTGIGMDLNLLNQTATRGRGTGLGLQVSKEMMKLHNGQLDIESKVGQGTTVILSWEQSPLNQDYPNWRNN